MALTQVQGGMLAGSTNTTTTIQSNGTTAITIDSSQNVGIGTSSPATRLDVRCPSDVTQDIAYFSRPDAAVRAKIALDGTGIINFGTSTNHPLAFLSNNTERMRITSGGNFLVNGTTPIGTDGNLLANSDYTATYRSVSNGAAYLHAFASDVSSTRGVVYAIYCNGTAGAVSDQNLKKNIEPARNYLDDLMNIEVVKYNWISDEENAPKELGYIAQQVETVFPGMVDEQTYNDGDGEKITQKMLKKEVFIPMMLKAIQELNAKVEAQAAEIAALKAAP